MAIDIPPQDLDAKHVAAEAKKVAEIQKQIEIQRRRKREEELAAQERERALRSSKQAPANPEL